MLDTLLTPVLFLSFGREPFRRLMAMQNEKVEGAQVIHA